MDHAGRAHGVVETTRVAITPLHLGGDDVARDEAEGFSDAADRRRAHVAFWNDAGDMIRDDAGDPTWQLRETDPIVVAWLRLVASPSDQPD